MEYLLSFCSQERVSQSVSSASESTPPRQQPVRAHPGLRLQPWARPASVQQSAVLQHVHSLYILPGIHTYNVKNFGLFSSNYEKRKKRICLSHSLSLSQVPRLSGAGGVSSQLQAAQHQQRSSQVGNGSC